MPKRILVPLDGSEDSESIVPIVAAMAQHDGATVRLLRVFPVPERVIGSNGQTVAYTDQEMARLSAEGLVDLRRVEALLDGVPVESVVRFGNPAEEILLEADAFHAGLVALTRSRSGLLREIVSPDVATRVARAATTAVLLLEQPSAARA
jgi:nucleotide-binding universal stress UspA family protein